MVGGRSHAAPPSPHAPAAVRLGAGPAPGRRRPPALGGAPRVPATGWCASAGAAGGVFVGGWCASAGAAGGVFVGGWCASAGAAGGVFVGQVRPAPWPWPGGGICASRWRASAHASERLSAARIPTRRGCLRARGGGVRPGGPAAYAPAPPGRYPPYAYPGWQQGSERAALPATPPPALARRGAEPRRRHRPGRRGGGGREERRQRSPRRVGRAGGLPGRVRRARAGPVVRPPCDRRVPDRGRVLVRLPHRRGRRSARRTAS